MVEVNEVQGSMNTEPSFIEEEDIEYAKERELKRRAKEAPDIAPTPEEIEFFEKSIAEQKLRTGLADPKTKKTIEKAKEGAKKVGQAWWRGVKIGVPLAARTIASGYRDAQRWSDNPEAESTMFQEPKRTKRKKRRSKKKKSPDSFADVFREVSGGESWGRLASPPKKKRSKKKKMPSQSPTGWFQEPVNHSLASRGVKVGKKRVKR